MFQLPGEIEKRLKKEKGMAVFIRILILMLTGHLLAACTGTELKSSWSSPYHKEPVKNVYIIGIAKSETNRRIFEDFFTNRLESYGVRAIASYRDLPTGEELDKDIIARRMADNGCDSVLLTTMIGQRSETVGSPAGLTIYARGPYYGGRGIQSRPAYYNRWDSFFVRRQEIIYEPTKTTEIAIMTLEAVLYDLKTEQLVWSANFETIVERNLEKMMNDFTEKLTMDLKEKGII